MERIPGIYEMTVTEIKAHIPAVIARFKERIPRSAEWIDDLPIKVATHRTAEKLFNATMQEFCARTKDFTPNTAAEVFTGENGYAIIVYQYSVRGENDLRHKLWHELGHVCSHYDNRALEDEAYRQNILRLDTPLVSGYAVWMEFIAEAISNYVAGCDPDSRVIPWSLQDRLKQKAYGAFCGRYRVYPYALGQYYAYLLTDSTVATTLNYYTQASSGLNDFPVDIQNATCLLSQALHEHLYNNGYFGTEHFYGDGSNEFWKISREQMDNLGMLFDDLYYVC